MSYFKGLSGVKNNFVLGKRIPTSQDPSRSIGSKTPPNFGASCSLLSGAPWVDPVATTPVIARSPESFKVKTPLKSGVGEKVEHVPLTSTVDSG